MCLVADAKCDVRVRRVSIRGQFAAILHLWLRQRLVVNSEGEDALD